MSRPQASPSSGSYEGAPPSSDQLLRRPRQACAVPAPAFFPTSYLLPATRYPLPATHYLGHVLVLCLLLALIGCGGGSKPGTSQTPAGKVNSPPVASSDLDAIPAEQLDRIVGLFNKGVGLMDQFKPVEAAEVFDELVRLAPNWTTGRLNLGIALLNAESQSYDRAERELKEVIRSEPDSARAHYALGMLLVHLGRSEEALSEFRRVLEIDPQDGDTHYQLGVLLASQDSAAAQQHLETALEKIPHHASACYRLQSMLRRAGDVERGLELLARFQTLKTSGAGITSGMKYGEMGRYATVIHAFGPNPRQAPSASLPVFADVAEQAGLLHATGGSSGWPGSDQRFGPGVAAADVDGDDDLDLCIPTAGAAGGSPLLLNEDGGFAPAPDSGVDDREAIGAYFGDYDRDGDVDLFLTCRGPNRLYQNDGQGHFADVTLSSGITAAELISVGAAWADADHDGDLDLYVANFASSAADLREPTEAGARGVPNVLWRNNGDGTFTDVATASGIDGGPAASVGVLFFDVDDDRDLDLYVVNHGSRNRLFFNSRVGEYRDATSEHELLADAGPGLGGVLGDVDADGRQDLLLLRGAAPPRLFLQVRRGQFAEDHAFRSAVESIAGASGGLLGDLDLDGDLDLVLLDAGSQNKTGHRIFANRGNGRFEEPVHLGGQDGAPDAQGAIAVDLDQDGGLELVVARAGARPQLWRSAVPADRHWLNVLPLGASEKKVVPTTLGLQVEIKSGFQLQVATIATSSGYLGGPPARAHFGLGQVGKADYVRLSWPDAVLQSEMEIPADQTWEVAKVERKPSSCPVLFSWDGERFAFVTDFLGVGGVGFFMSPKIYAPPDPSEDVRIPPGLVKPREGRYLLRVVEPLEEVAYLDELFLRAYDHPADWEIHADERFTGTAPFPTGEAIAVARKIFPNAARNQRDEDVLPRILAVDRHYVEPPIDQRFVGHADEHWVELDFGEQLREFSPESRLILFLHGWVEYTYSHVNYAAMQAGRELRSPWIEAPDGQGGWSTVMAEAGFPAGLPRMMTVDISSLPVRQTGKLRIRTNMEVFWDQIFLGEDVAHDKLAVHTMRPLVAELRPLGYPREYSPDGRHPALYDYHRLEKGLAFKNLTGDYTRFGDVRPLLDAVDDQFVIMGRGEEVALEFDANSLPALPAGWSRTLVLHSDGYCKDMDLYTALPDTVEPLPFHAMRNYPPREPARDSKEYLLYRNRWNTRRVSDQ